MSKNVFWKSIFRKPLVSILLLVLLGVLSFGFTSRAVEYLMVHQEIERISENYHAIGTLVPGQEHSENVADGVELLAQNEYVDLLNRAEHLSGEMNGIYNADLDGIDYNGVHNSEILAWAKFKKAERGQRKGKMADYYLTFRLKECIAGYPDLMWKDVDILLVYSPQFANELDEALSELTVGEIYLIRYYPTYLGMTLHPVLGEDVWFLNTEDGMAAIPEMVGGIYELEEMCRHTMNVLAVEDVSLLPEVQETVDKQHLVKGRWLDQSDTEIANPVCVIHQEFARMRNIDIGDSIEITLRAPEFSYFGYPVGENDIQNWKSYETDTKSYTVVGIWTSSEPSGGTFERNGLYIPMSCIPESMKSPDIEEDYSFSFVLADARDQEAFLREMKAPLEELGIEINMLENNLQNYLISARVMEQKSKVSLLVFCGVLLLELILTAFIYAWQHRRVFAIARAIGVPASKTMIWVLTPLAVIGLLGLGVGTSVSWNYALQEATETLAGMQEGQEIASLSLHWLVSIIGLWWFLLLFLTTLVMGQMACRPVLGLLQGGVRHRQIGSIGNAGQESFRTGTEVGDVDFLISTIEARSRWETEIIVPIKDRLATSGRFVVRLISRSAVRSMLAVIVATGFILALGWINQSIISSNKEVDRLYKTTIVRAKLAKQDYNLEISGHNGAYITEYGVQALKDSGLVQNMYLDATAISNGVSLPNGSTLFCKNVVMHGTNDIELFCDKIGEGVEITYAPGYGPDVFKDEEREGKIVIVPETWLTKYELEYGEDIEIHSSGERPKKKERTIVGSYRGGQTQQFTDAVILPLKEFMVLESRSGIYFRAVEFEMDPIRNRELETVVETLLQTVEKPSMGLQAVTMRVLDEELRNVVEPFEKNLVLMQILYPVTLAVSVLVGCGLIYLLLLQRAQEAALLRVLGNSLQDTRMVLGAEAMLLCLGGLLVGALLQWIIFPGVGVGKLFVCVGLYLLGSMLGTILGVVHITRKMPLELLQVKE